MANRDTHTGAAVVSGPQVTVRLTESTIDTNALLSLVAGNATGATVLFLGTVRETNEGRDVVGIDYSAYAPMAEKTLQEISSEAAERFHTHAIAVEHRLGTLELGDVSVVIAVSHERRAAAFDAARYIIEELKKRVPIWKREHYADGTREWVDPTRTG